ncbi:MAG: quinolinate synthase NadA, partial [Bacteroidota bacterium]
VHESFSKNKLENIKRNHPDALIIAHPECEDQILKIADYIGSTTSLLNFTVNNKANKFIVVTETGILHQMQKKSPNKVFIPAPPDNSCACNDCPHMKRNTMEKLYSCLLNELPEIVIPELIRAKAYLSIKKMLDLS